MNVNCFLGANSCAGFYSLYDGFCRGEGDFLHMIKAGPGGGKSGFMRRIARAAAERGYDTECVLCSGDPESLDAVYIPKLHIGFMDATAPHACEAANFAYKSNYVNLGRFCERIDDPRIASVTEKYRAMYKTAYSYLAAAGNVERADIAGLISAETIEKVRKRAQSAAAHEMGSVKRGGEGFSEKRCFIRCISCMGELTPQDDITKLCKRIYLLDDRFGLAGTYIEQMRIEARLRGENTILCPSPLCPEKPDALLLPDRGLGFVSAAAVEISRPWRHVRLDALAAKNAPQHMRSAQKRKGKLKAELTAEAVHWLRCAKENHDELERVYNPHVDFAALNAFADEVIAELFK